MVRSNTRVTSCLSQPLSSLESSGPCILLLPHKALKRVVINLFLFWVKRHPSTFSISQVYPEATNNISKYVRTIIIIYWKTKPFLSSHVSCLIHLSCGINPKLLPDLLPTIPDSTQHSLLFQVHWALWDPQLCSGGTKRSCLCGYWATSHSGTWLSPGSGSQPDWHPWLVPYAGARTQTCSPGATKRWKS